MRLIKSIGNIAGYFLHLKGFSLNFEIRAKGMKDEIRSFKETEIGPISEEMGEKVEEYVRKNFESISYLLSWNEVWMRSR
jgi:hypothetical protein